MSGGSRLERLGSNMSEFVFLLRSNDADYEAAMGTPERAQQSLDAWLQWMAKLERDGALHSPGLPLARGGRCVSGKELEVTDGPFAEAKDLVLGFIVIRARDLDDALELAKGCPLVRGGGIIEIRPVAAAPG
jgi:hypothetical protein